VIAVQLPTSDPGTEIAAACVAIGLVGGGIAWLMWGAGRDARTSAASPWGRTLGAVLFQVGRTGVAIAALLLAAGTWIGLTTHTAADERRAQAQAGCQENANLQHLTGPARADFMRQCVWERSD
jgi:hypothetical protein